MGGPAEAARPAVKKVTRSVAKPVAKKTVARPAMNAVRKTVARPAVKAAPTRAAIPTRTVNRAPAQEAAPPARLAPTKNSTKPVQDASGLANSIRSMQTAPVASPMGGRMMRGPSGSHEIGEAMRVTGQSRNLSMGLLFSKDNDKIEFGNPRMHYKDKMSSKQANY